MNVGASPCVCIESLKTYRIHGGLHCLGNICTEEVGRDQFNLATPTYATVNKTHLKLLQEEFKVKFQKIFG